MALQVQPLRGINHSTAMDFVAEGQCDSLAAWRVRVRGFCSVRGYARGIIGRRLLIRVWTKCVILVGLLYVHSVAS